MHRSVQQESDLEWSGWKQRMKRGCSAKPYPRGWRRRSRELKKPVCNLPEPGRMVELLLKRLSEQYHIPMEDKTEEQQEAAESEEDNGE